MNLVDTIEQDAYISSLEQRAQIAFTFFNGIAQHLETDLELARKYKTMATDSKSFASAFDGLDIKVEVERGDLAQQPSRLTLSSRYSKIEVFVNDPPGWMFIRISKRSPIFDGVVHFGVIEVALQPQRNPPYELNFTRLGWLWFEGMPDKEKIRPPYVAELLWKHLVLPEVGAQLENIVEKARR